MSKKKNTNTNFKRALCAYLYCYKFYSNKYAYPAKSGITEIAPLKMLS